MNPSHFILDGHTPVVADLMTWARWFSDVNARRVATDTLPGDVLVSTVFLGLDHNFGRGLPLLFETMILGGEHDGYSDRYTTWDEAEAGHAKALAMARSEVTA